MYAYNNYVRLQEKCTRTTIMYEYKNNVRVKRAMLAHVRIHAQKCRARSLPIVSQNALPPPEKSWNDVPAYRMARRSARSSARGMACHPARLLNKLVLNSVLHNAR